MIALRLRTGSYACAPQQRRITSSCRRLWSPLLHPTQTLVGCQPHVSVGGASRLPGGLFAGPHGQFRHTFLRQGIEADQHEVPQRQKVEFRFQLHVGDTVDFIIWPRGTHDCDGIYIVDMQLWQELSLDKELDEHDDDKPQAVSVALRLCARSGAPVKVAVGTPSGGRTAKMPLEGFGC